MEMEMEMEMVMKMGVNMELQLKMLKKMKMLGMKTLFYRDLHVLAAENWLTVYGRHVVSNARKCKNTYTDNKTNIQT